MRHNQGSAAVYHGPTKFWLFLNAGLPILLMLSYVVYAG